MIKNYKEANIGYKITRSGKLLEENISLMDITLRDIHNRVVKSGKDSLNIAPYNLRSDTKVEKEINEGMSYRQNNNITAIKSPNVQLVNG